MRCRPERKEALSSLQLFNMMPQFILLQRRAWSGGTTLLSLRRARQRRPRRRLPRPAARAAPAPLARRRFGSCTGGGPRGWDGELRQEVVRPFGARFSASHAYPRVCAAALRAAWQVCSYPPPPFPPLQLRRNCSLHPLLGGWHARTPALGSRPGAAVVGGTQARCVWEAWMNANALGSGVPAPACKPAAYLCSGGGCPLTCTPAHPRLHRASVSTHCRPADGAAGCRRGAAHSAGAGRAAARRWVGGGGVGVGWGWVGGPVLACRKSQCLGRLPAACPLSRAVHQPEWAGTLLAPANAAPPFPLASPCSGRSWGGAAPAAAGAPPHGLLCLPAAHCSGKASGAAASPRDQLCLLRSAFSVAWQQLHCPVRTSRAPRSQLEVVTPCLPAGAAYRRAGAGRSGLLAGAHGAAAQRRWGKLRTVCQGGW